MKSERDDLSGATVAHMDHRKARGSVGTARSRKRVLHVEDDPAVAASVRALLRSAGFEVTSMPDGPAALAALSDGSHDSDGITPDVLIVDFQLPGDMDGAEVAEAIARAVRHPVPTILLSGDLSNATLPWLPGAPIWPLSKPCAPEKLLEAVACFATVVSR